MGGTKDVPCKFFFETRNCNQGYGERAAERGWLCAAEPRIVCTLELRSCHSATAIQRPVPAACRFSHDPASLARASGQPAYHPASVLVGGRPVAPPQPSGNVSQFPEAVNPWVLQAIPNLMIVREINARFGVQDSQGLAEGKFCPTHFETGVCPRPTSCQFFHGQRCDTCGRWCLDPADSDGVARHLQDCQRRSMQALSKASSRNVECSICMERVLEKDDPSQRQFGLLACNHPFCLSCIRDWRAQVFSGASVDDAVRTCPICRTPTHFVCPSPVWPDTPQLKEEIVGQYVQRLNNIDCKYYRFGEGECPFGTSCFYRHADRQGRLQDRVVRTVVGADGAAVVRPMKLSDYLATPHARAVLGAP